MGSKPMWRTIRRKVSFTTSEKSAGANLQPGFIPPGGGHRVTAFAVPQIII